MLDQVSWEVFADQLNQTFRIRGDFGQIESTLIEEVSADCLARQEVSAALRGRKGAVFDCLARPHGTTVDAKHLQSGETRNGTDGSVSRPDWT